MSKNAGSDRVKGGKNEQCLERLLSLKSKLIRQDQDGEQWTYTFEEWSKDLENERRWMEVFFRVLKRDGEVYMFRTVRKEQKFICVGGPHDGEKRTEADAKGYWPFNRAAFSRGGRNADVPRVVLVHGSSFQRKRKV